MHLQEKEWRRKIIIGCVVAAIFFGWWLRGFLYSNWHFQLFSRRSWSFISNEFEQGWMLSSTSDWIFLLTLLLAIPTFLYLWYLCAKIRWRRLLKKIIKALLWPFKKLCKKNTKKKSHVLAPPPPALGSKPTVITSRPQPVGHSGPIVNILQQPASAQNTGTGPTFTGNTTALAPSTPPNFTSSETPWQTNLGDSSLNNMPLEDIELPQREPVVENIPELFENAGYHLIPNVKVLSQKLDFLALSADKALAILLDKEPGDWLAEEEPFNGEAPLWFSEIDHRVSPIYDLKKSVTELQKKISPVLPDIKVHAFMIEQKGNIINAEEMLKIWKELDVTVTRTDIGGMEDLPVTATVIEPAQPASMADIEKLTKLIKGEDNG